MKILMATDCYLFQTGGVTSVILALERGLRNAGHEVRVLALSNDGKSWRQGDAYFIRSHRFPDYPEHRFSLAFHDPLLQELAAWRPDLVHIHTEATAGWMAKALARKTGAPVIMTTHTDFEYFIFGRFRQAPPVQALGRAWGRLAYRQAQQIIVPAEKARKFPHLQPYADIVTVIPNGIRLEKYQRAVSPEEKAALFARCGLQDSGRTLITVSRLSREKNLLELLRFFPALLQALPGAQLIIVGEGPQRGKLESFCRKQGLEGQVRLTGRIPPEEVYQYYRMADLYVSASLFELHSMSLLEAMACGLPLLCREDDSLLGVLENGENGWIYHDESEFVRFAAETLTSPALHSRLSQECLRRAEQTDEDHFAWRTLALYEEVRREWTAGEGQA